MEYQKRPGTSGIDGQLYETKLLALILFRLQHDPRIEHFNLATNVKELGDFDDICLGMKIKGFDRPLAVFLQLKHKEDDKAVIRFENKDRIKYVYSFLTIKRMISSRQFLNSFFVGNLSEIDCLFVLYTNATFSITDSESKFENGCALALNDLLATSDKVGHRAQESEQFVEDLADYILKNELVLLVQHFVEFLVDKSTDASMNIMNNEYIQKYHVILRRKVVDVSAVRKDDQESDLNWRTLTFQEDFFTTNDKDFLIFRVELFKELLKKQREVLSKESSTSELSIDDRISGFLSNPSPATLAPLIITHIECNDVGKLVFLIKRPSSDVDLLQQVNMSRLEIDKAIFAAEIDAREYLRALKLKVPISFGNVDLAIRGSEKKINRRLKYLTTAIINLCKEYEQQESYKIVKIDDRLGDGLLSHNGGLASTVGNLLTYDEESTMLQFSHHFTQEHNLANTLFIFLKELIVDIFEYRFIVKTKKFPKLYFDCTDTAREFLSKLIIYENQSNHWKAEEILKEKIRERLSTDSRNFIVKSSQISDSVFLHYHEEILKWWMSPLTGTYLTKTSNLYEQALYNVEAEPQISALNTTFYTSKARYLRLNFIKTTTNWMQLSELPSKTFIATDTVALTTAKVIQYFRNLFFINKFAVIDFEFVLSLPLTEFNLLNEEIRNTEKVLILVGYNLQNISDPDKRLPTFAQTIAAKQLVVITNNESRDITCEIFFTTIIEFYNETESLTDIEQQQAIMKGAKLMFQGQETSLDLIFDDETVSLVKGGILDKVICNETINIGAPLSNAQYEEVKYLYIDRYFSDRNLKGSYLPGYTSSDDDYHLHDEEYVSDEDEYNAKYCSNESAIITNSFLDLRAEVVLITAPPGMGKSTLLTHLSLSTKEHAVKLWIVRVNFIDYSKQFHEWYEDEIDVDVVESLKFLCQVILRNREISFDLEILNGEAHLMSCEDDELAAFELNIFLHFYNQRSVIFIFDGFDEICPYYKEKVISFLTVAKNCLRKCKMWVTSRPYSDILPDLERVLGKSLSMTRFSIIDQETYLKRFFQAKFKKFNDKQLNNLRTFIENTSESIFEARILVARIYRVFLNTVRPLLRHSICDAVIDKLNTILKGRRVMKDHARVNRLSGIPLLLYFLADYFVNTAISAKNQRKTFIKINLHIIYEMFIKNKVSSVLFQDKNKSIDLSNPVTRRLLEKEVIDCISIHKKLAAYGFYENRCRHLRFSLEEIKDMKPLDEKEFNVELDKIKTGTEKVGLISHVSANNEPVFIHKSFQDYFIAEYVCDILNSDKFNIFQKNLWYCLVNKSASVSTKEWIERKRKIDSKFQHAITEMEKTSPIYLTPYRAFFDRIIIGYESIRILASSINDFEDGCFSKFVEKYIENNFDNFTIGQKITEFFRNYVISKMKPHLKQYFKKPTLLMFQDYTVNVRNLESAADETKFKNIILKLKITGHTRSVPLLIVLKPQNHCDIYQTSNIENSVKNCHEHTSDYVGETDYLFIHNIRSYRSSFADSSFASKVKDLLIATNTICTRLHYSEQHVKDYAEKILEEDITDVSEWLEYLMLLKQGVPAQVGMHNYQYIIPYFIILRQQVFDISDIQTNEISDMKWRTMTFRDEFFYTDDSHIACFRNRLFENILSKKRDFTSDQRLIDILTSIFLSGPSMTTLIPLIGAHVVGYEDNNLKFLVEKPHSDVEQLRQINIPQSKINEANSIVRTTVVEYLRSLELGVPIQFGNIDFIGDIENMKTVIVQLCKESVPHKVVTIDDNFQEALLSSNGGLINCVGNILVYDEETGMLKISDIQQFTSAQENTKSLYIKLSHEIHDLHEYRFDVKTNRLPKYQLNHTEEARQFLSNVVVFAEPSNCYEVEEFLADNSNVSRVPSKILLLLCHYQVLKWWMSSKTDKSDAKPCDLYRQAIYNIKTEPAISELHTWFYYNYLEYFGHSFSEENTLSIEPSVTHKLFIVTETIILTTVKLLRRLKNRPYNEYAVLAFDELYSLYSSKIYLFEEIRNTGKFLIVVCAYGVQELDSSKLKVLLQLAEHACIVIANEEFRVAVGSDSVWSSFEFKNEIESFSTINSHKEMLKDTAVIFPGQKVN